MLSFASKSNQYERCNLADLLDQCVDLAGSDYDLKKKYDFREIQILREYEEGVPFVSCESGKIRQVFLNILRNGAEAMQSQDGKGCISKFILRIKLETEKTILVEIEDNGVGMEEAVEKTCI